jgi:hypothetical protein
MWHCIWCGEMTLAYYNDAWSDLCPDCQDDLAMELWPLVRLFEEAA